MQFFLPQEFRRSHSRHLLEESTEMMGILEAQQVGDLSNGVSFHQKVLGLVYYESMYITNGGTTGGLMDHVAEVAGGIGQFACAPGNSREALFVLQPL